METANSRKVSCVANYAYEASESDELSLRPGDVLRDVERLPGGWWRGELRGRRGMFPDNFVTVLNENTPNSYRTSGIQGRCRAVFSYHPANPDELPLCVGDELEVLGEVEEGWWQGRRQGRLGVFPSNFVVMISGDPPNVPSPAYEPAPALPPKPVKELCRVLFPYTAVNDDELTLCEGDIVTLVSRDAPDRGWWRGELRGRVGLFPDNFVQVLPPAAGSGNTTPTPPGGPAVAPAVSEPEEKKPERPLSKGVSLPKTVLNKYSEKISSVKELSTSKIISTLKDAGSENVTHKESTIMHTNKSDTEKSTHSETVVDGLLDGQGKKPPVPMKKSPTPASGVGSLLSGLKNKMLSTSDKDKSNPSLSSSTSNSNSSGEWDRPDGGGASKPAASAAQSNSNTFDHIERNSILNDPRAGRVKAPRRRPPSQVLRDDLPQQLGLSNGQHDANVEKPQTEKAEEIKPKSREWEKHRAPWMEELKLNQAKKTSLISEVGKSRSVSEHSAPIAAKATGSTDRILDCGLEEKKSTHSMEMSRSTSSITSRMSVLETFEEAKIRHSLDSKKDAVQQPKEPEVVVVRAGAPPAPPSAPPSTQSPTAAGRTFSAMVEEIKKPPAPAPPVSSVRTSLEPTTFVDKSPSNVSKSDKAIGAGTNKTEKSSCSTTEKQTENVSNFVIRSTATNSTDTSEKSTADKVNNLAADDKPYTNVVTEKAFTTSTLERRLNTKTGDRAEDVDALISQLNDRISNLEKLLEVQNAKFNTALEELNAKLIAETDKRKVLQEELEKLSHCVTQV